MKHTLAGIVALIVAASLAASCGGSSGSSIGAADREGGSPDGTMSCGGSGEPCCNGTACNTGFTCSSGTCAASAPEDATGGSPGDVGVEGEADDTGSGSEAGDAGVTDATLESGDVALPDAVADTLSPGPETGQDSGGDGLVADAEADARSQGNDASAAFSYMPSNFAPTNYTSDIPVGGTTVSCNMTYTSPGTAGASTWCGGLGPYVVPNVAQIGGPNVDILVFAALTVDPGFTLTLTGSNPVIFAVYGDATISGTIDASAGAVSTLILPGTVQVTNNRNMVTFSTAQTLPQGSTLVFASQPGTTYTLETPVNNATMGLLTGNYSGTTNSATQVSTTNQPVPGPGGGNATYCGTVPEDGQSIGGGGGGGGRAVAGGEGTRGNGATSNYDTGGAAFGSSTAVPLVGGCSGAIGGNICNGANCQQCQQNGNNCEPPGAGGGGVQISAAGAINLTGTIQTNGSAGTSGGTTQNGGGGGGSAGDILLEGTVVSHSGSLSANGGAGGDGGNNNGNATGGVAGSAGTNSGASQTPPGNGGAGSGGLQSGGGGGGSYGYVVINL